MLKISGPNGPREPHRPTLVFNIFFQPTYSRYIVESGFFMLIIDFFDIYRLFINKIYMDYEIIYNEDINQYPLELNGYKIVYQNHFEIIDLKAGGG